MNKTTNDINITSFFEFDSIKNILLKKHLDLSGQNPLLLFLFFLAKQVH